MHQMSSAVGRVQLKYYDERTKEIDKAMRYFWDGLKDFPALKPHATSPGSDLTMGGWYYPLGLFDYKSHPEGALNKNMVKPCRLKEFWMRFLRKTGHFTFTLSFRILIFSGPEKPTMISFADRDVRQYKGSLPHAENIASYAFGVPWFKKYEPNIIDKYISGI